jgi:hypothetical protein
MNSRRDLLKLFGTGALIAPVVGAAPIARLIEPAKIELIKPEARILRPIDMAEVSSFDIVLHKRDGSVETLHSSATDWRGTASSGDNVEVLFTRLQQYSPMYSSTHAFVKGTMR